MSVCRQCSCPRRQHTSRPLLMLKGVTCTAIRHDCLEDDLTVVLTVSIHVAVTPAAFQAFCHDIRCTTHRRTSEEAMSDSRRTVCHHTSTTEILQTTNDQVSHCELA